MLRPCDINYSTLVIIRKLDYIYVEHYGLFIVLFIRNFILIQYQQPRNSLTYFILTNMIH